MPNQLRRRTQEKELRMGGTSVGTKQTLEAKGMLYLGTLGQAARKGYLTPRACEKFGRRVSPEELAAATNFAMMADCYADLCIAHPDGVQRKPCLPVFYRGGGSGGPLVFPAKNLME